MEISENVSKNNKNKLNLAQKSEKTSQNIQKSDLLNAKTVKNVETSDSEKSSISLDEFKSQYKFLASEKRQLSYGTKQTFAEGASLGKAVNPDVFVIKNEVKKMNVADKENKESGVQVADKTKNNHRKIFVGKSIVAVFLAFIITVLVVASVVAAGSVSADNVVTANVTNTRVVQAKLSSLGYFSGEINGVYNQETIEAIKSFQSDKNLAATGSLDSATTVALGVTNNAQANTDLYLLAKLIYSEARGEVYEGQVAVGAVVLNRVADAGFPNTLQGVIYQPWAFTALHDGQFSLEPNGTAYQAAQDAMNGWDPTYGCLYYYNPRTATSSWIFSRQIIVTIGNHVFCV